MGDITDWLIAAFTLGLLGVGWVQARLLSRSAEHFRTSERAYVGLSHTSPGLVVDDDEDGSVFVMSKAQNTGNTPADVSDALTQILLLPDGEDLPAVPAYQRTKSDPTPRAFLRKDGHINLQLGVTTVGEAAWKNVVSGTTRLWVVGYVDYRDKFGVRHRAGYARFYNKDADDRGRYENDAAFAKRNNLHFAGGHRWNYDRPRVPGEGNDWDEN